MLAAIGNLRPTLKISNQTRSVPAGTPGLPNWQQAVGAERDLLALRVHVPQLRLKCTLRALRHNKVTAQACPQLRREQLL